MFNVSRFVAAVVTVVFVGLVAARAPAQCSEAWSPVFQLANADDTVQALVVDQAANVLYAGGRFTTAGGVLVNGVARWDGSTWSALGSGCEGFFSSVQALALFDDGTGQALYAGGYFDTAGGLPASNIARWDGSAWTPLGSGCDDEVDALVVFDDGTGPALYAGGNFNLAGGAFVSHIARWNGTFWSGLDAGIDGPVSALEVYHDGISAALYAGGLFNTAGSTTVSGIAKWDGVAWTDCFGGVTGGIHGPKVRCLKAYADCYGAALYAGGDFSDAGGVSSLNVARLDAAGWTAHGGGVTGATSPFVSAFAVVNRGGGALLYAGGNFDTAGGVSANCVAAWDSVTWQPLGVGISGTVSPEFLPTVYALAGFDSGAGPAIYTGGNFTTTGGFTSGNIGKWGSPHPVMHPSQPGGPGTACYLSCTQLIPGDEYFNIFSIELAPGGPGTGTIYGLYATDLTFILGQFYLPVGSDPFHFTATGATVTFGPMLLDAGLAVEGICFDYTGGVFGCLSLVQPFAVQ